MRSEYSFPFLKARSLQEGLCRKPQISQGRDERCNAPPQFSFRNEGPAPPVLKLLLEDELQLSALKKIALPKVIPPSMPQPAHCPDLDTLKGHSSQFQSTPALPFSFSHCLILLPSPPTDIETNIISQHMF